MAESRLRRAAQTLRDPWGWLVAAVGGGAAWAVGLPVAGAGAVGVGMLAAATAVGAVRSRCRRRGRARAAPGHPATPARQHAGRLPRRPAGTCGGTGPTPWSRTGSMRPSPPPRRARAVSLRVAAAVDDLDDALDRADEVARQMISDRGGQRLADPDEPAPDQLLAKLSGAVDGVGELYTKLLELSATTDDRARRHRHRPGRRAEHLVGLHPAGIRRTRRRRRARPRVAVMAIGTHWEDYFAHHDSGRPARSRSRRSTIVESVGRQSTWAAARVPRPPSCCGAAGRCSPSRPNQLPSRRVSGLIEPAGGRLTVRLASFADLTELPPARLVHAGFSLPFCPPDRFDALWTVDQPHRCDPAGLFVGQLFGDRDTWAETEAGFDDLPQRAADQVRGGRVRWTNRTRRIEAGVA